MDKVKKKKWSVLFIITVLFMFFASPLSQVNAEINWSYGTNHTKMEYEDMTKPDEDAGLIGIISIALLQFGHLVEGLVAILMGMLTGNSANPQFPWADQIIFNALPILDVNFIHPADGSLFSIQSGGMGNIGQIIRNLYFTGISIAVGFLSIIIGVMSVRMAITTIASTKATYKESIINLLTTLVLIFGLHFILSGMFFLNEKLVETASSIVTNLIDEQDENKSGAPTSISGMGTFFYDTAKAQGGYMDIFFGLISIPAAAPVPTVLYLIFIGQSLIFLIAYFKRFFFVIILSVIGPFVVIFDFLKKAIS